MARFRRFDAAGSGTRPPPPAIEPAIQPAIEEVRVRRAGLKAAMSGLEVALAAAATPGRVDEWTVGVREALAVAHEVWTRHVVETEAPGAFLDELVQQAPRLAMPASRLRREHSEIVAAITGAEAMLDVRADGDEWVEAVRAECTKLLVALARHRQRGADLVYEAYEVDLGGGG